MKKIALPLLTVTFSCLLALSPIDNFIAVLAQKMDAYYQSHPQEQVHLIFNQEKYAPSDTAFFQTYLVNEDFSAPKGKRILTLGIFGTDGKMTQKINFNVFEGRTNNQIVIPSSTQPGTYLFAVYYTEAEDPSSSFLYSKEISIVGKNKLSLKNSMAEASVSFALEGGNFIYDLENKLLITSNKIGTGKIKNSKNQEVAQFTIGKEGIASVLITPLRGESYSIEMDGVSTSQPLPPAKEDGCTLRVTQAGVNQSRSILISIPQKSALKKKNLYLVVTNRKKIAYSAPVAFSESGQFQVKVPGESLKNGLCQATVFDDEGEVLAERVFLTNQTQVVASVEATANIIAPREKVDIEFTLRDNVGNPLPGDFSISVFQKELFPTLSSLTFGEEVLLKNSFYQIKKELPTSLNEAGNPELLDHLLAMKIGGTIPWSDILNPATKLSPRFTNNLKIRGKAIFKNSGKPVPDSTLLMGYLQNTMVGYEAHTTKNGSFEMPFLYDFWGNDELFYLMEYKGKEMSEEYQIIPEAIEFKVPFPAITTPLDSTDAYGDYTIKKKIVEESYTFFSSAKEKTTVFKNLNERFEDEAMGTDFTVNVQDYIAFPTMEDLIREVVPYLQHRKKGSTATVKLLIKQKESFLLPKGEPLFLIDGVLTKNKNFFMSLKPVDVMTIKLINNPNKLSPFGVLGKNGIVLVETKKSVAASATQNSTVIHVQGLSKPLDARHTTHSSGGSPRIPDLRALLYWNPLQSLDSYGKSRCSFYTSDNVGSFGIVVRGITKQGEPFEARGSFEVSFSKKE
jgi:hypothetical protein